MVGVEHAFTSAKSDDADATLVRASDWNAAHVGHDWYRVTADIVKSDTALADITGLGGIAIAANEVIAFEANIYHLAAATTTGMSFAVNGPASPTYVQLMVESYTTAAAGFAGTANALSTKVTTTAQLTTILTSYVHGMLENGSTAGSFALQWSPEVAASATIKRGSWLRIHRF